LLLRQAIHVVGDFKPPFLGARIPFSLPTVAAPRNPMSSVLKPPGARKRFDSPISLKERRFAVADGDERAIAAIEVR
jgi:hypothetical protein